MVIVITAVPLPSVGDCGSDFWGRSRWSPRVIVSALLRNRRVLAHEGFRMGEGRLVASARQLRQEVASLVVTGGWYGD